MRRGELFFSPVKCAAGVMKKFPSLAGAASPPVRRLSVRYGLLLCAYWVDPVAIASGSPRGGAGGSASFILYDHTGGSVFAPGHCGCIACVGCYGMDMIRGATARMDRFLAGRVRCAA